MTFNRSSVETDPSRSSYYVNAAFYQTLVDGLKDWETEGAAVEEPIRQRCEALLYREARLLDTYKLQEWLTLFTPECLYWVPAAPDGGDPRQQVSLVFDDRRRLEDRVYWLECGYAYSQTPRSRTVHLVSNVEAWHDGVDRLRVRANLVIHEFRAGQSRTVAGWCGYRLQQQDEHWRIAIKQVHLMDADQGQENLTFLL